MTADREGLLLLGGAVLLLGAGWPVTRVALLDGASPASFALGRAGLSAAVLAAGVTAARQWRLPGRADLPALGALGLLQLGSFFALAHAAAYWVPAGRTAILSNATLVWTVPIALLLTGEAIGRRRAAAAALSVGGVAVLAGPWAIDWSARGTVLGHAFLLGAALGWALAMAVVRRWPPRLSALQLLPWAFALASLALLPLALAHPAGNWSGRAPGCLLLVGLVMGPVGTWCVVRATARLPLVLASVGFLAGPAIGLLLSVLFLGEPLTASVLAGAAMLLGAAVLAATGRER